MLNRGKERREVLLASTTIDIGVRMRKKQIECVVFKVVDCREIAERIARDKSTSDKQWAVKDAIAKYIDVFFFCLFF